MSLHPHHNESTATVDLLSAIDELAENNKARVANSRRGNNRVELNCAIKIAPANASERGKFLYEGRCRDLSPSGGRLVLDQALLVGDVYLLYLEGDQFRLDPTFVRCIRCHLIREGDFECGVSFLSPVDLDSAFGTFSAENAPTAAPSTPPVRTQAPVQTPAATPAMPQSPVNPAPAHTTVAPTNVLPTPPQTPPAAVQQTPTPPVTQPLPSKPAPIQITLSPPTPTQATEVKPVDVSSVSSFATPSNLPPVFRKTQDTNPGAAQNTTPVQSTTAPATQVTPPVPPAPASPARVANDTAIAETSPGATDAANANRPPIATIPVSDIEPAVGDIPVFRQEMSTEQVQIQPEV